MAGGLCPDYPPRIHCWVYTLPGYGVRQMFLMYQVKKFGRETRPEALAASALHAGGGAANSPRVTIIERMCYFLLARGNPTKSLSR